jgi:hypothetical protein
MKIISTDNFGGDYPNEKFVAEGISNPNFARVMALALNDSFSGDRYYKVVTDEYVLLPGFEP